LADAGLYNAILEENINLQSAIQKEKLDQARQSLASEPWESSGWQLLPLLEDPTDCLCVYDDSSGYFRCGANCTWTVPNDASKVQFQIWGAGAGSNGARCCGGSPFGATGAYATVIIDAVPGCEYTLCAGCATCCYAEYGSNSGCSGDSYVTGYGLSNFCAEGGNSRISCPMCLLHSDTCCRWRAEGQPCAGPCICGSGSWYCFDNSCATCGEIPWIVDTNRGYYGSADSGEVFGLPSIFSSKSCLNDNNYGYHIHPPQIGPCHTEQSGSCSCQDFTSSTCGGCCCQACDGCREFPGGGGTAVHVMSGCCRCGDAGRAGMVRVTWC